MKNKLLLVLLIIIATFSFCFTLMGCGKDDDNKNNGSSSSQGGGNTDDGSNDEDTHVHDYSNTWTTDATNHWHECSCGAKTDLSAHDFGTEWITDATNHWHECSCGAKADLSAHDSSNQWAKDETSHWKDCSCGAKIDLGTHNYVNTSTVDATCTSEGMRILVCDGCFDTKTEVIPITHDYSVEWSTDETNHWRECDCGAKTDLGEHDYSDEWSTDETSHWHECACGKKTDLGEHDFSDEWSTDETSHWRECSCGKKTDLGEHNYELTSTINPTCTTEGEKTFVCDGCGDVKTEVLPITHDYIEDEYFYNTNGHWHKCACGASSEVVAHEYVNNICVCGSYKNSSGLAFTLSTDKTYYALTGMGTCKDTTVVIPSTYSSKPVKVIGKTAGVFNYDVTCVVIPNTVTTIEQYAFSYYSKITSIIFREGSQLTTIGERAFYLCTGLTSITIPEKVTTLGNRAFQSCENLTEINFNATNCSDIDSSYDVFYDAGKSGTGITVNIGANVTKIPSYLFYPYHNNGKITGVNFKEGSVCKDIGRYAFYATSISTINIPNSVTNIGIWAFANTSLETVTIPNSVETMGVSVFSECSSLQQVVFEENSKLTQINEKTFYKCTKLSQFAVPTSVTTIGEQAYYGCTSLTSVTIPNEITTIESSAFSSCSKISTLVFDGVMPLTIKSGAFSGLSNIKSITIAKRVTSIGEGAFSGASKLTNVTVDADNAYYKSEDGVLYTKDGTTIIQYPASKSGATFTVPTGVEHIGNGAFSSCANLTEVVLVDGLKSIGNGAFSSCTNLTRLFIPEGVTSMGSSVFYDCTNLQGITIPNSMQTIGTNIFKYCDNLRSTYKYGGLYYFGNSTNNYLLVFKMEDAQSRTITIHKDTKFIYDDVFKSSIMSEFNYEGTIDQWAEISFGTRYSNPLSKAHSLYINSESVQEVVLTTATKISPYAFYDSRITSITIPSTVTIIGEYAFAESEYLNTVTFDANSQVKVIPNNAFENCVKLATIVLPESITEIGDSAFSGCTALTEFTIPANVIRIGINAFKGCSAITKVTFISTSGWTRTSSATATTGTTISGLSNTTTAKSYLVSTYYNYYWNRKV